MEFLKIDLPVYSDICRRSRNQVQLSIVIPTYNSSGHLENTCRKIINNIDNIFTWEIIIADDCSSDTTWDVINSMHQTDLRIKGIRLKLNSGQQQATLCGFLFSSGKWIITMDDDLQHNPEYIQKLYSKASEGYDIGFASPDKKYSLIRKTGSLLHDLFFFLFFRKPSGIKITSFRIISKDLAAKIIDTKKNFIYISAIALNHRPDIFSIKTDSAGITGSRYDFYKLLKLFFQLIINYSLPDCVYNLFSGYFSNKNRDKPNNLISEAIL